MLWVAPACAVSVAALALGPLTAEANTRVIGGCEIHAYTVCPHADLSQADLSYVSLYGADLSYANINFASLGYALLSRANLSRALLGATRALPLAERAGRTIRLSLGA